MGGSVGGSEGSVGGTGDAAGAHAQDARVGDAVAREVGDDEAIGAVSQLGRIGRVAPPPRRGKEPGRTRLHDLERHAVVGADELDQVGQAVAVDVAGGPAEQAVGWDGREDGPGQVAGGRRGPVRDVRRVDGGGRLARVGRDGDHGQVAPPVARVVARPGVIHDT